jgi:glycogen operon protein
VLGPRDGNDNPIFIVLNSAAEGIPCTLPKMPEYKHWRQILNTADGKLSIAVLASGSDIDAPPRSVLAFAGSAS